MNIELPKKTVFDEMRETYSDCCNFNKPRRLNWRSEEWVSLEEAADCYSVIGEGGYNNFHPNMLYAFAEEFKGAPLAVTCGREGSPVLYIHITHMNDWNVRQTYQRKLTDYAYDHFCADEVDWFDDYTLRVWWD
jgi:hypothetical protein